MNLIESQLVKRPTANEIWDKLDVTHGGTNQVNESKISMLVHSYELFKMKQEENITEMFTRFH